MINHYEKCIFVHIPKCAGQSVETFFLRRHGFAWKDRAVFLLRPNDNSALGPPRLAHLLARDYVERGWVPSEMFEQYFKFTVVRNPWSRAVSYYRYLGYDKKISFARFVRRHLIPGVQKNDWFLRPQWDYITDCNGTILVDFIARMENLESDFKEITKNLGLYEHDLPKINLLANSSGRFFLNPFVKSYRNWRDYYDAHLAETVAAIYKRDVKYLDYSFS